MDFPITFDEWLRNEGPGCDEDPYSLFNPWQCEYCSSEFERGSGVVGLNGTEYCDDACLTDAEGG